MSTSSASGLHHRKPATTPAGPRRDQEDDGFKEECISFDMALLIGAGILMVIVMAFAVIKGDLGVQRSIESWLPGGGSGQVQDMSFRIQVPLEAIYLGQTIHVRPPSEKQVICDACRGFGAKDGAAGVKLCPDCQGTGHQNVRVQLAPGFVQQFQQDCQKCQGRGRTVKHRCPKCAGNRVLKSLEKLAVPIPRGCAEGHVLRLTGQGHQVPDVGVGDVVLELSSAPHAVFRREGSDLHTQLTITLKQSLLGFETTLTHLDGRKVLLSRADRVTPHKSVLEIKQEGIPQGSGSLFVTVDVAFPNTLSSEQVRDLRELLA